MPGAMNLVALPFLSPQHLLAPTKLRNGTGKTLVTAAPAGKAATAAILFAVSWAKVSLMHIAPQGLALRGTCLNVTVHVQKYIPRTTSLKYCSSTGIEFISCRSLKANTTAPHVGMQLLGLLVTRTGVFTRYFSSPPSRLLLLDRRIRALGKYQGGRMCNKSRAADHLHGSSALVNGSAL